MIKIWYKLAFFRIFRPEDYFDSLFTLIFFIIWPGFFIFTDFCSGSISFILNGLTVFHRKCITGKRLTVLPWFFPCSECGFYGSFDDSFDFLVVSTFVMSNSANIFDSGLTNLFLSLSPLRTWSNSSPTKSDIWLKKSNILSVKLVSLFSSNKNAFISSNNRIYVSLWAFVKVKNLYLLNFFLSFIAWHCQSFVLLTWKIDVNNGIFYLFDPKYQLLFVCLGWFFMFFRPYFHKNYYSKFWK